MPSSKGKKKDRRGKVARKRARKRADAEDEEYAAFDFVRRNLCSPQQPISWRASSLAFAAPFQPPPGMENTFAQLKASANQAYANGSGSMPQPVQLQGNDSDEDEDNGTGETFRQELGTGAMSGQQGFSTGREALIALHHFGSKVLGKNFSRVSNGALKQIGKAARVVKSLFPKAADAAGEEAADVTGNAVAEATDDAALVAEGTDALSGISTFADFCLGVLMTIGFG